LWVDLPVLLSALPVLLSADPAVSPADGEVRSAGADGAVVSGGAEFGMPPPVPVPLWASAPPDRPAAAATASAVKNVLRDIANLHFE
jgi:hypothetical protein